MKTIRSLYLIINYKTLIVTTLSLVSTWLCMRYNFQANLPLTLVGIAIVFPVVFSIDSAYKRRERGLMLLADFESHLKALFMAPNDWIDNINEDYKQVFITDLVRLYADVKAFFTNKNADDEAEIKINVALAKLSATSQKLREYGMPAGEMSRVNQYLSKILIDIENLKAIYFYPTPITLRAYSRVFIYSFPVLYAPYFVYAAQSYSVGLEYMMPVLFSFILVSLDNIQAHLESPFDQLGEDDIKFNSEKLERDLRQRV